MRSRKGRGERGQAAHYSTGMVLIGLGLAAIDGRPARAFWRCWRRTRGVSSESFPLGPLDTVAPIPSR